MNTTLYSDLSPRQVEALALVMEEAAEVVQVCSKILRHGFASHHPARRSGPDNRRMLETEIGDLIGALVLLKQSGDISQLQIDKATQRKLQRMQMYLHHNTVPVDAQA